MIFHWNMLLYWRLVLIITVKLTICYSLKLTSSFEGRPNRLKLLGMFRRGLSQQRRLHCCSKGLHKSQWTQPRCCVQHLQDSPHQADSWQVCRCSCRVYTDNSKVGKLRASSQRYFYLISLHNNSETHVMHFLLIGAHHWVKIMFVRIYFRSATNVLKASKWISQCICAYYGKCCLVYQSRLHIVMNHKGGAKKHGNDQSNSDTNQHIMPNW